MFSSHAEMICQCVKQRIDNSMKKYWLQEYCYFNTWRLLPAVLCVILFVVSPAMAEGKPPTYEDHVLPVFREKCCSCHNADRKAGGLDLTSYQQVMAGGNSGEVVVSGDPDDSYLWLVASHEVEPVMPPDADRIPDPMLKVIKEWIVGGIIERDGAKPVATEASSSLALDSGSIVKPSGPPVLPPRLSLEPCFHGLQPTTIRSVDASPHGDLVAVGSSQQVLLFDPRTRECIGVLPFPEGECTNLQFSRSAKLLLAGGGVAAKSGRIVIWDVATAQRVMELGDEYDEVLAADLSADQRLVALGGSAKVVRLLQTSNGSVESEITKHTDWITSVAFSPDSVLLATGDRAGNLFLWESFGARHWGDLKGQKGGITAIDWRADGVVLATASEDGTIHIWEADAAKKLKSWSAHGGGTTDVRWLNDGRLVSTGRDRKVKLWKADGSLEKELGTLPDIGTQVAVTSGEPLVITGDWSGQITVYDIAKPAQLGVLDSNPEPLAQRVDRAKKATVVSKKKKQDVLLEKEKALKDEANLVTQLAAANKNLGNSVDEKKNKKALAEVAAAGVKAAEAQLLEVKAKVKKANEIVSSLEVTVNKTSVSAEKEVAEKILNAAKKTLIETKASVVRVEQKFQKSQEVNATAIGEQKAAEKKLADANSQVKQLNEQVENAVSKRKMLSEKHAVLAKEYKACEKILNKWQDELAFTQNASRESE